MTSPARYWLAWRRCAACGSGGNDVDRLAILEHQAQAARRLGDVGLLGEAFTALGDELAACGQSEAAQTCYRQVLGILDGSDLRALGAWAWRALHRPNGAPPDAL